MMLAHDLHLQSALVCQSSHVARGLHKGGSLTLSDPPHGALARAIGCSLLGVSYLAALPATRLMDVQAPHTGSRNKPDM